MYSNFIIRRRQNKILYTEFFIVAIIVGFLLIRQYKFHPALGLLFGVLSMGLSSSLFFANRIFRYLFSIVFSFVWGFLAFVIWGSIDSTSNNIAWGFMALAFAISLAAHQDHFYFLKRAKRYEYEIN